MTFEQQKDIRFSFSTVPTSDAETKKLGLPFGCLYTPLSKLSENSPLLENTPLVCPHCKAIFNPYAKIDADRKVWICPICGKSTPLPTEYHKICSGQMVPELMPENTTVEYLIDAREKTVPVYFFVVDSCCSEKQHQELKNLLLKAIAAVPENAIVGFITFGTILYVHQVAFEETPRSFLFNGKRNYTAEQLTSMLHVGPAATTPTKLIGQIKDVEANLNLIIDQFDPDKFEIKKGQRAARCTGAAINMAVSLLEILFPGTGGHILVFSGGPITKGPGKMAELERTSNVRTFDDITGGNAPLTKSSIEYFKELGNRANAGNIVVNYIAASFEETGFHELEPLVTKTGGFHILAESWGDEELVPTIVSYFSISPLSGSEAIVTINGSQSLAVAGQIGAGISNPQVGTFKSSNVIGRGNTDQWHVVGVTPNSTLGFYLDVKKGSEGAPGFVQILTRYRHLQTGLTRLRVTTAQVAFSNNQQNIANGFDQEAAVALLGRLAMERIRIESNVKVIDYIDESVVTFCRKFAPNATFADNMTGLPLLVYYLRRLKVFTKLNATPDLTNSIRATINTLNASATGILIVPVLTKYEVGKEPEQVALSAESLNSANILVLTSYQRVVVWHGRNIAIAEKNKDQTIKDILAKSEEDAKMYIAERFPAPRLIKCDEDSSQARYLLASINPPSFAGKTNKPNISLQADGEEFIHFLKRLQNLTK